jgi:hypothetical protein
MPKLLTALVLCVPLVGLISCSDDDGSDVPRNSMSGGAGGQAGSSMDAGVGGSPGGASGASGRGGGGAGGASGSSGCSNVLPDAGSADAGDSDAGLADAGGFDAGGDGGASSPVVSFAADIHPIFVARCGPCHVSQDYANHNVGGELDEAYLDAVRLGEDLVDRVNGGGMPPSYAEPPNNCDGNPGDPGCLTVAEVELIQTWLDQCTPR